MDPKIGNNSVPPTQTQTFEELAAPLVSSKLQSSSGSSASTSWVEQASQRLPQVLALFQKIVDATCAESSGAPTQGAQALSPEQARYEKELAAYQEAIATNERVDAHNAKLDKEIADLQKQYEVLGKLLSTDAAKGDGVLTWSELQHLSLNSSDDEVKKAAQWLLGRPNVYKSLPRKETLVGGDEGASGLSDRKGIDVLHAQSSLGTLLERIEALDKGKLEKVKVPSQPTPSPAVKATESTGLAGGAGTTSSSKSTTTTATTSAEPTTSGSGIDGALDSLYAKQASLEEQISAAAAKAGSDDPNVAAEGQREMQRLMNRQQALANMINLLTTMMSNLAKLYADMAMTAVRNIK